MPQLWWLDLETTSLSPLEGTILEIAVAEASLEDPFTLGATFEAVRHLDRITTSHVELGKGNPPTDVWTVDAFVMGMHTKNGLWADCLRSEKTLRSIEEELLALVPWVEDKEERPILAGSTIHFDQGFLRAHMPEFAKRFSHRLYDVSAIKLFCRSLGMEKVPKAEAHRAGADIAESAAHAKLCRDWLAQHFGSQGAARFVFESQKVDIATS